MSTHASDAQLDATLRTLDPADQTLTADQMAGKDALLAGLLKAPDASSGSAVIPRAGTTITDIRRGRRHLRWAVPAAAAAALVGVMTVYGGPGGQSPAYASWTPGPTVVDAETRAKAESACRASISESTGRLGDSGSDPSTAPTTRPEDFRTVAAERRGSFMLLAMAADDGSTQACFFDAGKPDRVAGAGGSLATAGSEPPKTLAPAQIEAAGGGMSSGPEGTYATAQGRVGADVTGVTLRTAGQTVQATVSNGWFAAWWPATWVGANAATPPIAYDVTLRDGRIVKDVPDGFMNLPHLDPTGIGGIGLGGGAGEDGTSVSTVTGYAGRDVTSVTVREGMTEITSPVTDGVFYVELPAAGNAEPHPKYDLTLKDGHVLRDQIPVADS